MVKYNTTTDVGDVGVWISASYNKTLSYNNFIIVFKVRILDTVLGLISQPDWVLVQTLKYTNDTYISELFYVHSQDLHLMCHFIGLSAV